jgi:hypothetical protein
MKYIGNAFSPSMLKGDMADVSFHRINAERAQRFYKSEGVINALNPRHPSTIEALGLNAPEQAITITLKGYDELLVVTPKSIDRTGTERELSMEDLSFTLVTVR